MHLSSDTIRDRIAHVARSEAELFPEIASDIAFHLTDWLDDFEALYRFYADPSSLDDKRAQELLFRFLVHVPNHLAAASKLLTGIPVTDIFQVGATTDEEASA